MAAIEYRDFVLVAEDVCTTAAGAVESFAVGVFDSPVGQSRGNERVAFPAQLAMETPMLFAQLLDFDVARQIALGRLLADSLLPPRARDLFRRSMARLREGQGLRLRLRLDSALAGIPWEYLWIPDSDSPDAPAGPQSFLALNPRISIARHEALPVPADWFDAPGKRRVVVAAASPRDNDRFPKLDYLAAEVESLREEFAGVPGLQADFLPYRASGDRDGGAGTTAEQIAQAMIRGTADVFHFMGHGHLDPHTGEAQLILADSHNYPDPIAANRFAEMLSQRGVRLALLDACHSGAQTNSSIGNVAMALTGIGIPAVIGMQHKVGDRLAAKFSAALYRALLAGYTVDEAVFYGRAAMRAAALATSPHARDWGIPVLYLRSAGGVVFSAVSDKLVVASAQAAFAITVRQHAKNVDEGGQVVGVVADLLTDKVTVTHEMGEVGGLVVGAVAFEVRGGSLFIKQQAERVQPGGALVGVALEHVGGRRDSKGTDRVALDMLVGQLRADRPKPEPKAPLVPNPVALTCPACGQRVEAGAKFCSDCGGSLRARSQFCRQCGTKASDSDNFCQVCGTKL